MNLFHALILGVVEGLTEFLPVSSTAHLIVAANLLHLPQNDFMGFFEVFIQSGAILAVLFLYAGYLLKHRELIKTVIVSFLPTAVIGFLLYKVIKTVFFESNSLIIAAMFAVAVVFLVLEYFIGKKKIALKREAKEITPVQAVLIGLAQSLAVIPGVSRSGIVMAWMMGNGYRREEAALYSFILAVPTIVAASGYDLFKMRHLFASSASYLPLLAVGFATSFVVAYAVMKWFIGFLKKNTLVPFALYRILLAIILLFVL